MAVTTFEKPVGSEFNTINTDIAALNTNLSKHIVYVSTSSAVAKSGGTATIAYPTGYGKDTCAPVYAFLLINLTAPRYFTGTAEVQYFDTDGIHVINNGGVAGTIVVGLVKLVAA